MSRLRCALDVRQPRASRPEPRRPLRRPAARIVSRLSGNRKSDDPDSRGTFDFGPARVSLFFEGQHYTCLALWGKPRLMLLFLMPRCGETILGSEPGDAKNDLATSAMHLFCP